MTRDQRILIKMLIDAHRRERYPKRVREGDLDRALKRAFPDYEPEPERDGHAPGDWMPYLQMPVGNTRGVD